MGHPLEAPLAPLLRDFRELQAQGHAFVLATVVGTEGSTYSKTGSQMLITASARLHGLLSGGCLEVDLVEHARQVLATGAAHRASYDMRGEDDLLFGIGSGCEGAMQILLQRVGPAEDWQPLAQVAACIEQRRTEALGLIVDGAAAGRGWWTGGGNAPWAEPREIRDARAAAVAEARPQLLDCGIDGASRRVLVMPLTLPPHLLVCGAGADAVPLARQAIALGLAVTVCDHRPALATAGRFPHCQVCCVPAAQLGGAIELSQVEAAIVMSHHLPADLEYLRALAACPGIAYVGLLGPAARRERLLADLGALAADLRQRLRAPLGLDIGARTPEAIALAAAAEIHAWLAGRGGRPWRETLDPARS
ncbi:MAG TPA: XdhC family protein [Steroidobacteraceae bacterium]